MRALGWIGLFAVGTGCAHAPVTASFSSLQLDKPGGSSPLTENYFSRDSGGGISEADLRKVLEAPVALEAKTRLGVIPVEAAYAVDVGLPLPAIPAQLSEALEGSGLFSSTTEVSTDWPAGAGVAGLRELAARYRVSYLLLYRQRFADQSWTNAWGFLFPTAIAAFVAPSQTLETDGVVEATLFDVKTGTILFTILERVHGMANDNVLQVDRRLREIKAGLLKQAAGKLAEQVVAKSRRLALNN